MLENKNAPSYLNSKFIFNLKRFLLCKKLIKNIYLVPNVKEYNQKYVKDNSDRLSIAIGLSKRFINFDNQKSRGFIRLSCLASRLSQNNEDEYYNIDSPDETYYSARASNSDELSLSLGYEFEYFLNQKLTFNFASSIRTTYSRNSSESYNRMNSSGGDIYINSDTNISESISIDLYGFSYGFKYYF